MTHTASTPSPRRKKLIEVALPLEAINVASAREKSIRHGHPSTLHLWWARRPLAACRAVLFSSFVDDPEFDPEIAALPDPDTRDHLAGARRQTLFDLIEELVRWENSNNPAVINRARAEIAKAVAAQQVLDGTLKRYAPLPDCGADCGADCGSATPDALIRLAAAPGQVDAFLATHAPPVLDPFAGGGSIPLEAQRLGLRAHASDLNPVPVLINKALIEIPPKFAGLPPVHPRAEHKTEWPGATGLAEDVRRYGRWMRDEAEKRIGHLYPKVAVTPAMAEDRPDLKPYVGRELTVIAWLWARTIKCPNPGCGRFMPMARSFWLSKKKGKKAYVDPVIDLEAGTVRFKIAHEGEPIEETSNRTMARCLFCGNQIKKAQLRAQARDYGMPQVPLAVVAEGKRGRVYLEATPEMVPDVEKPLAPEIDQLITDDRRWFSPPQYGLPSFRDLFTPRQLTALVTFSDLVGEARARVAADATAVAGRPGRLHNDPRPLHQSDVGPQAYADAVATYLFCGVAKGANLWSSICTWMNDRGALRETFARQALPMAWDFAEANAFSDSGGNMSMYLDRIADVIAALPVGLAGNVMQADAQNNAARNGCVISTDPPYYDNIGYADLSDFFYVWMRRTLGDVHPEITKTLLTPKAEEMIASSYRHDGSKRAASKFFEERLGAAIGKWRVAACPVAPTTIFYAFKQEESDDAGESSTGWETFLAGITKGGFSITATWPVRTESPGRAVAFGTNALASSIVLACVPRPDDAPTATRRAFSEALRAELPDAIRNMQSGNIAPVDLAQASIGPGMAVFSRYAGVENADGSRMTVREALQLINATLDEALSEQEADFDADTRWAIKWFEQHGLADGPFGDANTLANAFAIAVQGLAEAGVVKSGQGKVRLLRRDELPADWDPRADARLTVWETTQHLIRALETRGEAGAAALLAAVGASLGETAKELSYRLFILSERKKRAKEAGSYDALVKSWPEIVRLSRDADAVRQTQAEMFS